jgi:hypothetical protein
MTNSTGKNCPPYHKRYVEFTRTGIKVDVVRFLKSESGKQLLRKLDIWGKHYSDPKNKFYLD